MTSGRFEKLRRLDDLKSGDRFTVNAELLLEREEWLETNLYILETRKVPPGAVITFCGYKPGPGNEPFPMRLFQYETFTGYLSVGFERHLAQSLSDFAGEPRISYQQS